LAILDPVQDKFIENGLLSEEEDEIDEYKLR
jgi:hypothetical protein